jgi:hypothetical protein
MGKANARTEAFLRPIRDGQPGFSELRSKLCNFIAGN